MGRIGPAIRTPLPPLPRRGPWRLLRWPLLALAVPVFVLTVVPLCGFPLAILAALSIPYDALFPDHHAHRWDFEGTPHQQAMLRRWRARYRSLGLLGRVHRAGVRTARRWGRRRR